MFFNLLHLLKIQLVDCSLGQLPLSCEGIVLNKTCRIVWTLLLQARRLLELLFCPDELSFPYASLVVLVFQGKTHDELLLETILLDPACLVIGVLQFLRIFLVNFC